MSVTDPGPLRLVRKLDARPWRVFAALADPGQLVRWAWGSLARDSRAEVDFRVGGRYRITTERDGGEQWAFSGTYLEIEPDRRLVCTVSWEQPMGYDVGDERMIFELADHGDSTQLTFIHEGVEVPEARDEHEKGWINMLDTLAETLR